MKYYAQLLDGIYVTGIFSGSSITTDSIEEITEEQHENMANDVGRYALVDGALSTKAPSDNHDYVDGEWVLDESKQAEIDEAELKALTDSINNAVDAVYRVFTPRQREYERRASDAHAYKSAGYSGEMGVFLAQYATSAGLTGQVAADKVIAQEAALNQALVTLSEIRMSKITVLSMTIEQARMFATNQVNAAKQIGALL